MKPCLALAFMFLIAGCATAGSINQVSLGMTKAQVIEVMGDPTSSSAQAGVEYMNYALYETAEARRFGFYTPFYVRIIDGKVESYGRMGDFNSAKTPTQKIQIETTVKSDSKVETTVKHDQHSHQDP